MHAAQKKVSLPAQPAVEIKFIRIFYLKSLEQLCMNFVAVDAAQWQFLNFPITESVGNRFDITKSHKTNVFICIILFKSN